MGGSDKRGGYRGLLCRYMNSIFQEEAGIVRYFTGKSVARVDKGRSRRTQPLPLSPNILDFIGNAAGRGWEGVDYFWLGVYI